MSLLFLSNCTPVFRWLESRKGHFRHHEIKTSTLTNIISTWIIFTEGKLSHLVAQVLNSLTSNIRPITKNKYSISLNSLNNKFVCNNIFEILQVEKISTASNRKLLSMVQIDILTTFAVIKIDKPKSYILEWDLMSARTLICIPGFQVYLNFYQS